MACWARASNPLTCGHSMEINAGEKDKESSCSVGCQERGTTPA